MGQNLAMRIKVMFLGASLKQEIAWHDQPENATGKLMTRLSSDTMSIRGDKLKFDAYIKNIFIRFTNLGLNGCRRCW